MPENEYTSEELQQLLDVANSVIEQLDFFNEKFILNDDLINQPHPRGMNDHQADLYVHKLEPIQVIFNDMLCLSNEPLIGWIKLVEKSVETTYLVSRGTPPHDYHPKNYPNIKYVSKQAPLAAELFTKEIEKEFEFRNIHRKILYRDRYFIPQLHPFTDAIQNTIELKTRKLSVESLRKILELNKEDITAEITDKIRQILKAAELRKGLRRRIIQNIQLRDQPILDRDQITIYRAPLTANLIISGSAGTGKTTVLLNRISLATKPENLTDDEKLGITRQGLELLSTQKDNWILYTPTELLKNYLKEAFNKEGIPAPEGKIKVWHDERMDLGRNVLKFLIVGDKGHFRLTSNNIFIKQTNREIESYADEFRNYYLNTIEEKFNQSLDQVLEFDEITSFPSKLNNIKIYYESLTTGDYRKKVNNLIDRLSSEREYFNEVRGQNNLETDELINKIIKEKNDLLESIIPLLVDSTSEEIEESNEEEILEEELETSITDQFKEVERLRAYQQLKSALWQFSERKVKKINVSSKSLNGKIIELIKDLTDKFSKEINLIGTLRLTSRLTNQLTSGYIRNFIQLIPNYYSQFRNRILKDESQKYFEISILKEIKEKKYISEIETDILIFNMLGNTRAYFNKNLRQLSEKTNNDLLENVKSVYKNIVSVDEATDFSSITLGCMYYMCNPLIKSFTFSGDPMQRVTLFGIQDWDNIKYLKIETQVKHLSKVYRQSYKLLCIAKKLYTQFVGEPQFNSAFEPDDNEPTPLIYHNIDDEMFKSWITKRIIQVYQSTDWKASVALFVADDSKIDPLADLISESLADSSLEVERCKGGKILSNNSKVRIFSVEHIKGLEFEAVFYINIDEIFRRHPNLIDKYLYVGLTRAGSFLGITYKNEFPQPLDCIRDLLEDGDWSWLIE